MRSRSSSSTEESVLSAEADDKSAELEQEGRRGVQFPWKLHSLLVKAEKEGYDHVISWLPDGDAFKVHKKEEFCNNIMPKYFSSNKYKTWQRSLNLWGFESIVRGPNKGACHHRAFVRGSPELCKNMTRVKIKGAYPRPLHSHGSPKASSRPALTSAPLVRTQNGLAAVGFEPSTSSNKPNISDFLRAKASPRSSDAMLEAALIRRLTAHTPVPQYAGLRQGFMGRQAPPALAPQSSNTWLRPQLANSQLTNQMAVSSVLQQSAGSRLLSAINTAATALHAIRQEEAEMMRRAGGV